MTNEKNSQNRKENSKPYEYGRVCTRDEHVSDFSLTFTHSHVRMHEHGPQFLVEKTDTQSRFQKNLITHETYFALTITKPLGENNRIF